MTHFGCRHEHLQDGACAASPEQLRAHAQQQHSLQQHHPEQLRAHAQQRTDAEAIRREELADIDAAYALETVHKHGHLTMGRTLVRQCVQDGLLGHSLRRGIKALACT